MKANPLWLDKEGPALTGKVTPKSHNSDSSVKITSRVQKNPQILVLCMVGDFQCLEVCGAMHMPMVEITKLFIFQL